MANFCGYKRRCGKCKGEHERGECPNSLVESTEAFCRNCEQQGHPPSWKGCPQRKRWLQKLQDQRLHTEQERQQRVFTSTRTIPGFTFADAAGRMQQQRPQVHHQPQQPDRSNDIMGFSAAELNAKIAFEIAECKNRGERLTTKEERDMLLVRIIAGISINAAFPLL